MRRLILALMCLLALFPIYAGALGLGNIRIYSALGQRFDAEIPILSIGSTPIEELRVSLASPQVYEDAQVEDNAFLGKLQFHPGLGEEGDPVIHVTTKDPLSVPALQFIIQINWTEGQLFRQYTVLLDPLGYQSYHRQRRLYKQNTFTNANINKQSPSENNTVKPDQTTTYGPTTAEDTLESIAQKTRPDKSVTLDQSMLAIFKANPEAFNGNYQSLRQGQQLIIPSLNQMRQIPAAATIQRETVEATKTGHSLANDTLPPGTLINVPSKEQVSAQIQSTTQQKSPNQTEQSANLTKLLNTPNATTENNTVQANESRKEQMLQQELAASGQQIAKDKQTNDVLRVKVEDLELQNNMLRKNSGLPGVNYPKEPPLAISNTQEKLSKTTSLTKDKVNSKPVTKRALSTLQEFGKEFYSVEESILNISLVILLCALLVISIIIIITFILLHRRQLTGLTKKIPPTISKIPPAMHLHGVEVPVAPSPKETVEKIAEPEKITLPTESVLPPLKEVVPPPSSVTSQVDVLEEVDLFLNYERYEQARQAILNALEHEPKRLELKVKLLEIYLAEKDLEAFDSSLATFPSVFRPGERNSEAKIVALRRERNALRSIESPKLEEIEPALNVTAAEIPPVTSELLAPTEFAPILEQEQTSLPPIETTVQPPTEQINSTSQPVAEDKTALNFDSDRLRMRLLKVYASTKNRSAFDNALTKIPEEMKHADNPLWTEILALQSEAWPVIQTIDNEIVEPVSQKPEIKTEVVKPIITAPEEIIPVDDQSSITAKKNEPQTNGLKLESDPAEQITLTTPVEMEETYTPTPETIDLPQSKEELEDASLELQLNLLKVYAENYNEAAFFNIFDKIPEKSRQLDNPVWQKILELRDNTFFPLEQETTLSDATEDEYILEDVANDTMLSDESLFTHEQTTDDDSDVTIDLSNIDENQLEDEFGLKDDYDSLLKSAAKSDQDEEIFELNPEEELDLNDINKELSQMSVDNNLDDEFLINSETMAEGSEQGDESVQMQLEMAQTYIEMDDKAGARELLMEILVTGNPSQQAQAKELLEQLK